MIWEESPDSRVIEIRFSDALELYSKVPLPTTFHVCQDSRQTALTLYPKHFGNIIHPPRTIFNFERDVLYFREAFHPDVLVFVASLTHYELDNLKILAVSNYIVDSDDGSPSFDVSKVIEKAVAKMPSLEKLFVTFDLHATIELRSNVTEKPGKFVDQWPEELRS